MISEFSDNGMMSTYELRRRVVHHAVMKIVHSIWLEGTEISSITPVPAIASDRWVRQLYTQHPSGLRFVAVVRIGCGRYRVCLLELTSGFT